jgi:cation:H+ antiporter
MRSQFNRFFILMRFFCGHKWTCFGYNRKMNMFFSLFEISVLLVLIVACCSFFTNAIEWTGHRFNLSEGAVGSVLAAVGTALPETLVPIIAIMSGMIGVGHMSVANGHDIGVGAILGAPFLLGTLAMFVTACAVFYFAAQKKREPHLKFNHQLFRRDFHYFFPAYICVFLASYISDSTVKNGLAIGLVAFYGLYVYRTLKKEHVPDEEFDLAGLFFAPKAKEPSTSLILAQVVVSLVVLLVMVHFFVDEIQQISSALKIPAMLLSLIITPIATELPEKFNSVMWIRGKKDNLALGNITGAMVFQSCIPTAIGLAFTPWVLNSQGILSVFLCLASSLMVYFTAWKSPKLLPQVLFGCGGFYLLFLLYALFYSAK